jgi:hypothetical protein
MNTNKLLIIVVAFTMTTKSFAQVKYGVKAGLNLANISEKSSLGSENEGKTSKIGFHFGGTAEFPASEAVSVQTGLLFSSKGYKISLEGASGSMNVNYLEIPINTIYKIEIGSSKLCLSAGPYLAYAVSGSAKYGGIEVDVNIGSDDDDDYKALDYGLNIGAGVELNDKITIGLQYGIGLANISSYTGYGSSAKNNVFGISVGYMFGQ